MGTIILTKDCYFAW